MQSQNEKLAATTRQMLQYNDLLLNMYLYVHLVLVVSQYIGINYNHDI